MAKAKSTAKKPTKRKPRPKAPPKRTGRPLALTPEAIQQMAGAIRLGTAGETAAQAVGISRSSYYSYKAIGEAARSRAEELEHATRAEMLEHCKAEKIEIKARATAATIRLAIAQKDGIFLDFLDAIQKARAGREVVWLQRIEKAAEEGIWTAAAWKLERTNPARYGRRERLEHTGADGAPIETIDVTPARERIKAKVIQLAARRAEAEDDQEAR